MCLSNLLSQRLSPASARHSFSPNTASLDCVHLALVQTQHISSMLSWFGMLANTAICKHKANPGFSTNLKWLKGGSVLNWVSTHDAFLSLFIYLSSFLRLLCCDPCHDSWYAWPFTLFHRPRSAAASNILCYRHTFFDWSADLLRGDTIARPLPGSAQVKLFYSSSVL